MYIQVYSICGLIGMLYKHCDIKADKHCFKTTYIVKSTIQPDLDLIWTEIFTLNPKMRAVHVNLGGSIYFLSIVHEVGYPLANCLLKFGW